MTEASALWVLHVPNDTSEDFYVHFTLLAFARTVRNARRESTRSGLQTLESLPRSPRRQKKTTSLLQGGWISLLQMTTKIVEEIETGIETGMMEDIATAVAESGEAEEIGGSEDEAIDASMSLVVACRAGQIVVLFFSFFSCFPTRIGPRNAPTPITDFATGFDGSFNSRRVDIDLGLDRSVCRSFFPPHTASS